MPTYENKNYRETKQSGQALVEYILILGITVSLVLGLMNQLYKPFGQWLDNYMGQYLECLLDVGELPSFGSGAGSGECSSRFAAFSPTGGRPPIDNKQKGEGQKLADANGSGSSQSGNGEGSTSAGGSSRRGSRGNSDPFSNGKPGGSDSGSKENAQTITEKLPETNYMSFRRIGSRTVLPGETASRATNEPIFVVENRNKKDAESVGKKGPVSLEEELTSSGKSKKLIIKPQERKIAAEEISEPWDFSDYLRYGVIIIIIIAIILFLVGQAAQISKSMEKN